MNKIAWLFYFLIGVSLTVLLLMSRMQVATFLAVWFVWSVMFILWMVGPETISELTLWKASIKRDVQAAREIRDQVEQVEAHLREAAKYIAETSYILGSTGSLAMGADVDARERLGSNMSKLSDFAEPDPHKQKEWWDEVEALFAHRRQEHNGE